jgi:hypothetical protein
MDSVANSYKKYFAQINQKIPSLGKKFGCTQYTFFEAVLQRILPQNSNKKS